MVFACPVPDSNPFDYLFKRKAVLGNPVDADKLPASNGNEGSTPGARRAQARRLSDPLHRRLQQLRFLQ
jgi:hypothetical protein